MAGSATHVNKVERKRASLVYKTLVSCVIHLQCSLAPPPSKCYISYTSHSHDVLISTQTAPVQWTDTWMFLPTLTALQLPPSHPRCLPALEKSICRNMVSLVPGEHV